MPAAFDVERVSRELRAYCDRKVPPSERGRLSMGFRVSDNVVTLFERRAVPLRPGRWTEVAIAQFRHDPDSARWFLYWRDHSARWRHCAQIRPTRSLDELLEEVDRDPAGVFYG